MAIIVAAICLHPFLFAGVFSIIVSLLINEFYCVLKYEGMFWKRSMGILGGLYLFLSSFLYAGNYVGNEIFWGYIIILLIILIAELYSHGTNPVTRWGIAFFAQVYCAGTFSLIPFIAYSGSAIYKPLPVLMVFIFIWLNDSGAYVIGTWKGKHRLFERISPLKSWEGFWGGFVVAVIASQVLAYFYTELRWHQWLIFSVITVIAGTWGDLVESLLKRTAGVKDSGTILPGHGGVLDRFDSVMLAFPVVYVFWEFIRS